MSTKEMDRRTFLKGLGKGAAGLAVAGMLTAVPEALAEEPDGERLIPEGRTLMEVKCSGGYPLWLVRILSEERIYKTSFSKYGTAYAKMILPHGRRMPAAAAVRIPDRQRTRGEQWIGGKKYA